jgi:transketolase
MTPDPSSQQCTLEDICINTIRSLAMDAVQKANSGHPGAPMGLAAAGFVLWRRFLVHNPRNPAWADRDRFVLSGGHASMLLYSLLYLSGYALTLDDLMNFRQWGAKTPGHPEYRHTPGVETTTGPLGQGIANAVGMAMAERHLAARFNRPGHAVVDHHTYVMCGDGDLMEGLSAEAASLAGHLGLGRLICLYDNNKISIEGSTELTFSEDVPRRFAAMGWHVQEVADGNDLDAITAAIAAAKAEEARPSLISIRTEIAYGSPNKQGSADAHGAPLGEAEVCLTKKNLGCPEDAHFCVPETALAAMRESVAQGAAAEAEWRRRLDAYRSAHPDLARELEAAWNGALPEGWPALLPVFDPADGPVATRSASGTVLNALATQIAGLMGGSADLAPSNKTLISGAPDFQKASYHGRNIRFGVREHAMAAVLSGMALHGGIRPYGGTFLVFADYMRPAIRLAALMQLPVIYVFTHDSIAVGEDGPTHQPVEHLASLRVIPGLTVIRPADANETAAAWQQALAAEGPVALILSRQKLPVLDRGVYPPAAGLSRGGYVLVDGGQAPDVILIATGAEVHITLEAQKKLAELGVAARVVNLPSWELFERQDTDYRESVLPPAVAARVAVEAGVPMGWERYAGCDGEVIGMTSFGASAPGATVLQKFGFSAENIVQRTLALLKR